MKKALSLIVALVLCLSLVACGGSNASAEKAIVGEWVCTEEALKIQFNEDKTGILTDDGNENEITWQIPS